MKKGIIVMALIAILGCGIGVLYYKSNNQDEKPKVDTEEKNDTPMPQEDDKKDSSISQEDDKKDNNQVQNSQTTDKKTNNQSNTSKVPNNTTSNQTTDNGQVVGTTTKGYDIILKEGKYYVKGILIANKTYALPSNYNPGKLLNEFTTNYNNMKAAAKKEGITLTIKSGYRSYSTQKTLYNNYVKRDGQKEADTYSARAGHSEHQTGLAADLNKISNSFGDTKEGKWLANNCYKFGFILRYPKGKQSITGYMYEPWHFRYIGDEAINLYNNGNWITLEEYLGIDSKY